MSRVYTCGNHRFMTKLLLYIYFFFLQLQESRCFKKRIRKLEDANKKLALELEHEKGKLAGLNQSHNALREHTNILESALAKREADLVQLNLQVKYSTCIYSELFVYKNEIKWFPFFSGSSSS